jgi:hypothetical protein
MICFNNEQATIEYRASEQTIFCSWEGEVPSEQFQQVMKLKLQHMQSFLPRNWMMDIRYMQAIGYDDQQWLLEYWLHEFLKLPIRKIAIIQSFDIYNSMVVEDFLRYSPVNARCEVQLFADFEASLAWIKDLSQNSFLMRVGDENRC